MNVGQKGIRGGTRIPLELPVRIQWKSPAGSEQFAEGKTESMSGNGLFIVAPLRLRHDMRITFTITLPAEITSVPVQLQCTGRVVRQEASGTSGGIAVVIDDYRLTAAEPTA